MCLYCSVPIVDFDEPVTPFNLIGVDTFALLISTGASMPQEARITYDQNAVICRLSYVFEGPTSYMTGHFLWRCASTVQKRKLVTDFLGRGFEI